jgi:hypothetical protein
LALASAKGPAVRLVRRNELDVAPFPSPFAFRFEETPLVRVRRGAVVPDVLDGHGKTLHMRARTKEFPCESKL